MGDILPDWHRRGSVATATKLGRTGKGGAGLLLSEAGSRPCPWRGTIPPMNGKAFSISAGMALMAAGLLTGCVERKITIATDPPGALVYVNDVEMGRSPVTFPFTWYGDYDVRLRLDRPPAGPDQPGVQYYLHTHRQAKAPPYQWLGVDLFAEILPFEFKDEKLWAFAIPQMQTPSDEELVARAKALQGQLDQPTAFDKPRKSGPTTAPATVPATLPEPTTAPAADVR